MTTITTTLTTTAVFSKDQTKRYLLQKVWDEGKLTLAIIMLAPSEALGIVLDSTTLLVLNNAARLGYGSVSILNLFAAVNDFSLSQAEEKDAENLQSIKEAAEKADTVVYAAGVGKAGNKKFQLRQRQVLHALRPHESKLYCLCNESGQARLQHPLSPAVRVWHLQQIKIAEVLSEKTEEPAQPKKQGRPKKKEPIEKLPA